MTGAGAHHPSRDGTPTGICGLVKRDGLADADVGFAFLSRHCLKGYAVESASAVLAHARQELRLQRIVANTLNGAGQRQRVDSSQMEDSTRAALAGGGMKFAEVDIANFRDVLRRQGYYARVKARVGEPMWQVIQKATGIAA